MEIADFVFKWLNYVLYWCGKPMLKEETAGLLIHPILFVNLILDIFLEIEGKWRLARGLKRLRAATLLLKEDYNRFYQGING